MVWEVLPYMQKVNNERLLLPSMAAWKWVRTNATGTVRLSGQVRYMEGGASLFEFSSRDERRTHTPCALLLLPVSNRRDRFFACPVYRDHAEREDEMQEIRRKTQETNIMLALSEREEKLIRMMRDLRFGVLQVFVADGQPVRLEEVRRSVSSERRAKLNHPTEQQQGICTPP